MTDEQPKNITNDFLVASIKQATTEVFSMMLGLELVAGEPFSGREVLTESGVLALVGLAGPWMGTGSISVTPHMACHMASQMLMAEYKAVDDDVLDAMAEVSNMVIGNVKTSLEQMVGELALSTPVVIYGRRFETRRVGGQEWIAVPFPHEGEMVRVQLCLAPSPEPGRGLRPGFALPHAVQI